MLTEWSAESSSHDERAAMELALTVSRDGAGAVIEVHGALVCGRAERLAAVVDELLEDDGVLTMDLSRLTYLDSAGVAVLLTATERSAARSVDLRMRASAPAARLLDRSGVAAGTRGRATITVV